MDSSVDYSPSSSPRRLKYRSPSPRRYRKKRGSFSRSRSRSPPPRRRGSRDSETPPHSAQAPRRYYGVSSRGTAGPHRGSFRGSFRGRGFGHRTKPRVVDSYSHGYNNSIINAKDNDEPSSGKRHFKDNRENAEPCRCLGIFGMSLNTSEDDLFRIFKEFGFVDSIRVVRDHDTNRSRGFGFIYFNRTREAQKAKGEMEDAIIDGMKVRVDYSVTNGSRTHEHRSSSRSPPPRKRHYSIEHR